MCKNVTLIFLLFSSLSFSLSQINIKLYRMIIFICRTYDHETYASPFCKHWLCPVSKTTNDLRVTSSITLKAMSKGWLFSITEAFLNKYSPELLMTNGTA